MLKLTPDYLDGVSLVGIVIAVKKLTAFGNKGELGGGTATVDSEICVSRIFHRVNSRNIGGSVTSQKFAVFLLGFKKSIKSSRNVLLAF